MAYTTAGANEALERTIEGKYLALFTADGAEVSGGDYARVYLSTSSIDGLVETANGVCTNIRIIYFPEPTADWTTSSNKITKFKVMTASTGGTAYYEGDVKDATTSTVGVEVTTGNIFFMRVGEFSIDLD